MIYGYDFVKMLLQQFLTCNVTLVKNVEKLHHTAMRKVLEHQNKWKSFDGTKLLLKFSYRFDNMQCFNSKSFTLNEV